MHLPILLTIGIIFGITILVVLVCNYFRIPYLVGFLLTGIIVSPTTFGILHGATEVEVFAEIGVILLLFSVGLEFSIKNLLKIKKYVLVGGTLQVIFTILLSTLLSRLFGVSWNQAVFLGFIVTCSSTAIVIKQLQDRIEIPTSHGKLILAILLFQDIAIVPMMLLVPILSGQSSDWVMDIAILVLKLAALLAGAVLAARYLIPPFLVIVMKTKSQEVFLIATIFIVCMITTITSYLGLSLALGAFIAGLIVAETDYNKLAISCFLPFRYVFISFFFISLGMLLDYRIFFESPLLVMMGVFLVLILKFFGGFFAGKSLQVPTKTAIISSLMIMQVGEFSFILVKAGFNQGLISETNFKVFIPVAIITMAITPLVIQNADRLSNIFAKPASA
ncbi:MAG: cation:proton antiporter [Imperialibacter sp.]|uniref:cation:proton antiporter n=1 Tax=Imperialibacter sp. TaxID=2038411 RepID=UPI0032EF30CC